VAALLAFEMGRGHAPKFVVDTREELVRAASSPSLHAYSNSVTLGGMTKS
jgi:hypothetical protein